VQTEVAVKHGSAKPEIGKPKETVKSSLCSVMVLDLISEKIRSENNWSAGFTGAMPMMLISGPFSISFRAGDLIGRYF
jgi:hypothetical protein